MKIDPSIAMLKAENRRLNAIVDRFLDYQQENKIEIRKWAEYCRAVQPGPNLADTMLAYIGDPPHDYAPGKGTDV